MIDPKELRVGAHISINGERVRIEQIASDYIGLKHKEGDYSGYPPDRDRIEPIPITAELLEELGFEKRKSGSFAKEYAPDSWMFITLHATKGLCKVGIYPADPIREVSGFLNCYLHELESFLYLITKTELIK